MEKRGAKNKILVFSISFLLVIATAFIGSIFTSQSTNTEWYNSIKPSITPPNSIFPVAWTILFFQIALSLAFTWLSATKKQKKKVALFFGINLVLNIIWSLFYFGLKNPLLSFIDITALIISIISLLLLTWKINKRSFYLLIPYLLWVCFAAILNYLSIKVLLL